MKKFLPVLILFLAAIQTTAQAPQAFKYQAIARDMNGNPVINQEIAVKISILSGSPEGTVLYSEVHQTVTTTLGLVNLEVGNGTVVTGSFGEIAWGVDAIFIKIEMDTTGGDDFVFMGTSQLLSVPYSLFSDNGVPDGQTPGDMLYWNGTQWLKVAAGQNGQFLIFSDGVPTWGGVHLPILNTSAVTNITAFTAYSGGTIASDGGSPVISRGICWNTSPAPTTSNFKITAGSGSGNFLAQMTGLESSTQYFVRAFATNSAGTSYGQDMTFYTTAGNITLSTMAVSNITTTTAQSGGNITLNGGSPVIARGVCWNTAPYPTVANNKTTDGSGNGTFVSQLTGLANNTQYYVRAYATNSLGTSYGNQLTFTTLPNLPPVAPFSPMPEDGSQNQSLSVILSWSCSDPENDPLTYDVFFGTDNPPTQVATAISVTFYTPGTLNLNTTYFWKIIAHDDHGNSTEGEVWSFTTKESWQCGDALIDERDGQDYNTVQIGTQCWMAENLNIGTKINGSQNQQDNGLIEKYCNWNSEINCNIYGGLYQWDEMIQYASSGSNKGICFENWHIATDNEWIQLIQLLDGYLNAGGKMKEIGFTHWSQPNTGATNTSGFTGLPGGYSENGNFNPVGGHGWWWSSKDAFSNLAYSYSLSYNYANVFRNNSGKIMGHSVRCIKDETNLTNEPPLAPFIFFPQNGSTEISLTPSLTWSCSDPENDPLSYDIFFGTENPPTQVATAIADTFYTPGTLDYNTTYYWKIVAHDDQGNSTEGEVWSFTTMDEPWQCGNVMIDERDGKEYNTVQIGTQCWLAENLNVGTKINGGQNQQNNGTIEKYCYNNLESNCDVYGGLYQWDEMMDYTTVVGVQGICFEGWHLPSENEWGVLLFFLEGYGQAGGKLKEFGTNHWDSPNTGATNISGFTAYGSGYRNLSGIFNYIRKNAYFYSSSPDFLNYTFGSGFLLFYDSAGVNGVGASKAFGYAVRCIKNY